MHNYSFVISKLSEIFYAYCARKKLTADQSVMFEALPDDIDENPSDDLKQ